MQTQRVFVVAMLAGVLVFTSVSRAHAMDPYYQDLLSNMLYSAILGTPYGSSGNLPYGPSGTSSYDPYGNSTYGPYGNLPYGSSGNPPSYGSYRRGGSRCDGPARGSYVPPPYGSYQGRENPYWYEERTGRLDRKYTKAMNRLDRQEADARARAYRKSYGDPVRYNQQMAKIDRKYGYKRYKVERNTEQGYRSLYSRY